MPDVIAQLSAVDPEHRHIADPVRPPADLLASIMDGTDTVRIVPETSTRPPRRPVYVAVAAAVVAVVALAPLALLRSAEPGSGLDTSAPSIGIVEPPIASIPSSTVASGTLGAVPPAPVVNQAELGSPLLRLADGGTPPSVVDTGEALVMAGAETMWVSVDEGQSWGETAPLPDNDAITTLSGAGHTLVTIGANDGASARLYVSSDLGATWTASELPVAADIVQVVPHEIALIGDTIFVAGAATDSFFDVDTRVYLWRYEDGAGWVGEEAANMGSDFTFAEAIISVDGELTVLAQSFSNRVLAFEKEADSWRTIDVGAVIATEAGIGPEMGNIELTGIHIAGGELFTWWRFGGVNEDSYVEAGAMTRRTQDFGWEAKGDTGGLVADTVLPVDGGYVGIAHLETGPGVPAISSSILVSFSGLGWKEIARLEGVDLTQLLPRDALQYITVGNETKEFDTGGTSWTATAVWSLDITEPINKILDTDEQPTP